jgi:hypothetical protein
MTSASLNQVNAAPRAPDAFTSAARTSTTSGG